MQSLLDIENFRGVPDLNRDKSKRRLLVSINQDLKSDFGHYLNYEHRIGEACASFGADHICFANADVVVAEENLRPVFSNDSGHYSLVRNDARGKEDEIASEL